MPNCPFKVWFSRHNFTITATIANVTNGHATQNSQTLISS